MKTRAKANKTCPKIRTGGMVSWPSPCAHATSIAIPEEPTSVTQASKFPEWRHAMLLEFDALMSTNTWSLVPPTANQNIVGCRWIFKTKYLSNGSVEWRKARLVAKGYSQLEGLDYNETFSLVIKPTSIRFSTLRSSLTVLPDMLGSQGCTSNTITTPNQHSKDTTSGKVEDVPI